MIDCSHSPPPTTGCFDESTSLHAILQGRCWLRGLPFGPAMECARLRLRVFRVADNIRSSLQEQSNDHQ